MTRITYAEIRTARRMRAMGRTWREIGVYAGRDPGQLRRAVERFPRIWWGR